MTYGAGLSLRLYNHLPYCTAEIDTSFSFRAINFCASGRIYHQVESRERTVLPAPVFWWTWPGPRFRYGALPGESWDHYYLTFSGRRADYLATTGVLEERGDGVRLLQTGQACESLFRALLSELSHRGETPLAANLLDQICLVTARDAAEPVGPEPRQQELATLVREIEEDPSRNWETSMMADRLAVSEGHLRRLFAQRVDCPPHQFVIRQRMRRAATLLRTTNEPVKRVAAQVGIEDLAYFARLFKARFGYPPAGYRDASQLREGDSGG